MEGGEIQAALWRERDEAYRAFQIKLLPTVAPKTVIGVRTPALRALAKRLYKEKAYAAFLGDLPHRYFEENQLHAFLIAEMRDFDSCMAEMNRFLPYVDNWATCDQMSPKVFGRHKAELLAQIKIWLASPGAYAVRFAIGMLMQHFLEDDFDLAYPNMVLAACTEEYYVRMMVA